MTNGDAALVVRPNLRVSIGVCSRHSQPIVVAGRTERIIFCMKLA